VAQTRFTFHHCSPEKREKLDQKLSEIYDNIKSRFKFFGTFQDVLTKASGYSSADLKDEQEPEEFVKRQLIEPLIDMMGYEIVSATVLSSPVGRKKPDYTIRPKDQDEPIFYVEAEPFNTDLYSENHARARFSKFFIIFYSSNGITISIRIMLKHVFHP
jgi:hypothetical protein